MDKSKAWMLEWGSALLVVGVGALAGRYAAQGMTPQQWMGAVLAVLAAVSLAVGARVWPETGAAVEAED
jgi:drug/metabolite transporter (DMT)-like permease